jgi:membrane protease YdiL (CAAX protease family)
MNAPATALPAAPKPIAPVWHTVLFLGGLGGLSYWGVRPLGLLLRLQSSSRISTYLFIMASEWLLVGLVAWGGRLGGSTLGSLIGEKWSKPSHFFRDLGLSVCFLFVSLFVLSAIAQYLHTVPNETLKRLLPQSVAEKLVWVVVALTAGFCEELMIRGYLQNQLLGLLKNAPAAVLLQAVIFGAAHAYQGWKYTVVIGLLGGLLGWLAQWRRTLLPGMMAHSIQDLIGGLARGLR